VPGRVHAEGNAWVEKNMKADIGDRLHVHSRTVGIPDQTSEIIEIRGQDGAPPYLIRRDDGHEALVFPGPDATVEHPPGRDKN
jgi:hypothetical protein